MLIVAVRSEVVDYFSNFILDPSFGMAIVDKAAQDQMFCEVFHISSALISILITTF
jgi:hypothetical protein